MTGDANSMSRRRTEGRLNGYSSDSTACSFRCTRTKYRQSVPLKIEKHGKSAVWLIARRRDESHTGGDHALVGRIKIVDAQEHSDPTGELLAHNARLFVAVGTREQDACLASLGTNHDPTLRPAIIGPRRCIFHQLELQNVNEEPDSGIVVPHHQRDEFKMRHRGSDYS